jgi:hypothetical protein
VQVPQPGSADVAQRDGAGEAWLLLAAGRGTQDVVEHHGRDSPMYVSRRTFVCRTQMEVGEHATAAAVLDHQGRRHGIAYPDHDIAPRHLVAVGGEPDAVRTAELLAAQSRRRRIDLGLGRGSRLGADLGADGRVDQRPHRLGEWLVYGAQPGDVLGAEVLQGPVQHTCTRTRSSAGCRVTQAPGQPAADGSPGAPTR